MTAKDTMTWGTSDEKKEERPLSQSLSQNDYYKPKRKPRNGGSDTNRRSGNESNLRRSTARGSSENLASLARSDTDMGLRRSMNHRSSGNNMRSMAKRDERRSLSQSMSGANLGRHASDGTAGLRRSNGARGSSENLRGSMRRSSSSNGLRDSVTLRRASDGSSNHRGSVRGSSDGAGNLRRSSAGNSKEDLRGSIRRSSDANGSSRPGPGAARGNNQQRRPDPRRRDTIV